MPTVYDVPPDLLIKRLSEHLKRMPQISPPAWAPFVKTGSHTERPPQDRDWWYTRCASLLRKLYIHGPLGFSELESIYGGGKRVGYGARSSRDSGGSIIRNALKQLEAAGLVAKQETKGRVVTSRGRSLLDRLSNEIFKEAVTSNQSLARYS